jgi:DNA-binding transcriptional ArsR family regulator
MRANEPAVDSPDQLFYCLFDYLILDRQRMKKRTGPDAQLEGAATMFQALAEPARLQTLICLAGKERTVTELADLTDEKIATVSARLKVLFGARLVKRRRVGQNIFYSIADEHVLNLIKNAVDHAAH